jgi:hypothetical protein
VEQNLGVELSLVVTRVLGGQHGGRASVDEIDVAAHREKSLDGNGILNVVGE